MEPQQETKVAGKYDVAVIGGGPAGASGAFYAAKSGLRVVLLEKQAYPRQKPCGGALSGRCVPLLGEHARASINSKVDTLHLFSPSHQFLIQPTEDSFFVRREEFDMAMARDAREAGAHVMDNCRVKNVTRMPTGEYKIETTGNPVFASYIIQATGFQKNAFNQPLLNREAFEADYLAMTVVSETPIDKAILTPLGYTGYSAGIFFGAVPNGYGWCFIKNGFINIGIGASAHLLKSDGAIHYYHQFVAKLRELGQLPPHLKLEKERAFPLPFKRTVHQTVFENILLAGDIAGFVSPVTGEGLYYAIKSGQLAATAIANHLQDHLPLANYQENWLRDFGNDLNKYGRWIQKNLYKTKWRQELMITLGRRDAKMAELLYRVVFGKTSYKKGTFKIIKRMPVALLKLIF